MSEKTKLIPALRFPEFKDDGEWDYVSGSKLFDPIVDKNHNLNLPILAITQEQGAIPREKIDYTIIATDRSIQNYKVVQKGNFIISLRSFQGGIEYSNYEGVCSPAYIVLKKKKSFKDIFFKYYFKTTNYIGQLNRNLEGMRDGKMISYKQFSEILLPFPSDTEQQHIAACLSSLDALITAETNKLELLKQHKKGLMQNLFPQEGEKMPQVRFSEFKDSGAWEKSKIGTITKVTTGGTPESTNPDYWDGNIAWMNSGELNNKRIYSVSNFITSKGLAESSTKLIPPQCILIGLAGQGKTRGTAAINYIELCINQSIGVIYPNVRMFDSEFLYQKIDSMYYYLRYLSRGDEGRGGLNLPMIKDIGIFFPSLPEQRRIADCLSSLDELISVQTKKIEQLKLHKKGLMQGLFPKMEE